MITRSLASQTPLSTIQIGSDAVEALYQYAKFQFECGNYSGAAEFLYQYRQLAGGVGERAFSVAWGKLASEILMQNWEAAGEELNRLREMIDAKVRGERVAGLRLEHRREKRMNVILGGVCR